MRTINLFTTLGCHLCEQAELIAQPQVDLFKAKLQLVEIADSDELLARYGIRIPVLLPEGSSTELDWPFNEQDVQQLLQNAFV